MMKLSAIFPVVLGEFWLSFGADSSEFLAEFLASLALVLHGFCVVFSAILLNF